MAINIARQGFNNIMSLALHEMCLEKSFLSDEVKISAKKIALPIHREAIDMSAEQSN